jgi:hypothetical protein
MLLAIETFIVIKSVKSRHCLGYAQFEDALN